MISAFAFIGTAAAAYYTNASSTTTTLDQTVYTTIECSSPTAFEYGSSTFYVTEPTTLTVEQCECTQHPVSHSALPASSSHAWKPTAIPSAATESVTESVTNYVTVPCPSSTILTYGTGTYTVSEATTLTLEDCSCTDKPSAIGPLPTSVSPKPAPSAASPSASSATTTESAASPVGLASTPSVLGTASIPSIAGTTTTEKSTQYISIPCSSTTLTYNSKTYTVSDLTTLTLEDCSCTESVPLPKTTSPATAATVSSTASTSPSSSSNPTSSASPVPVASSSKSAVPSIANSGSLNKVGVAGILMVVANLL